MPGCTIGIWKGGRLVLIPPFQLGGFVSGDRIDVNGLDSRSSPRTTLLMRGLLLDSDKAYPVKIRNVSLSGALLEGAPEQTVGAQLILRRDEEDIPVVKVWSGANRTGVQFVLGDQIKISTKIPLSNCPKHGETTFDDDGQYLRDSEKIRQTRISDNEIRKRLCEEISTISRSLELIGQELSGQTFVLVRHSSALQALDLAQQTLLRIAKVIGSSNPVLAASKLDMEAVKRRLLRRSL